MKQTVLITGASSGIGRELARVFARNGHDLILTARREERLAELKKELEASAGVAVDYIAADLSAPEGPQSVYDQAKALGKQVDILVNNAGFGGHGFFHERDWKTDAQMIDLNIKALTELMHLYLPEMLARDSGKILNLGSTAGELPGPLQAVYYATKAYVNSLSEAVINELKGTNVDLTVILPGPVKTEFAEVGNLDGVKGFENGAESATEVAEKSYKALMAKKGRLITTGQLRFVLGFVARFLPRKTIINMSRQAMEKQ